MFRIENSRSKRTMYTDVVLINPTDPPATYPPLGICYLAAVLRENGISVQIIDRPSQNLTDIEIADLLLEIKPKIVGITVMTTLLRSAYNIIKSARSRGLSATYVAGGPYVNIEPDIILSMNADYAIIGDAELTFPTFCRSILNNEKPDINLSGLIINCIDKIVSNPAALYPDLAQLPFPAYDLLDLSKYKSSNFNLKTVSMITARGGCPFTCNFCGNLMKEKYRYLDPNYVCNQMEYVISHYQIKFIEFVDETFTLNKKKITALCEMILERNIKVKWSCLTRVDCLNEELLILMKKAGCCFIRFGVESGSERIRYLSDKKISNEKFMEMLSLCKKNGIKTLCFYIFGHPSETLEEMKETLKFSLSLPSDTITYSKMEPVPNSAVFEIALSENKISRDVWVRYMRGECDHPIYYPNDINPEDLESIYKKAFLKYFTSFRALKSFAPMIITYQFWGKAYNFIKIIFFGDRNLP